METLKLYKFTTNETEEVHTISGYSVFDALDMLEKAGYTCETFIMSMVQHAIPNIGYRWFAEGSQSEKDILTRTGLLSKLH